jgi:arginine/lysine/ornithine decarboxylase
VPLDQTQAPYLDALTAYAARGPERLHVPGHKGGSAADPGLREAIGERALATDIPALTWGIDIADTEPTPFQLAQQMAAEAWGAERTWFLVNGASQGNHVALLTLAHAGERVVVQRNAHSSTIDGCILAGLTPTFVAPEVDPELGVAHCLSPQELDRALTETPGVVGVTAVSPTYFGAVADIAGLVEVAHAHGVPLVVDEAWGAHLAFHEDLPAHALSLGADLVVSSTHKIVGSLTQSAMIHLGCDSDLVEAETVDRAVTLVESTSPNSLLLGSLDAARRLAATRGRELLAETIAALAEIRDGVRAIDGLDVLDDSLVGAPGVHGYDPLRLTIDVRGVGITGYELAAALRERGDVMFELAGENVLVGVFGMAEPAAPQGRRLIAALRDALDSLGGRGDRTREDFAPAPPWGDLVMAPREAFLAGQQVVAADDAVGRIAAESLATYPPGIPNVLPGERMSAATLDYIRTALDHGGSLRGASDRKLTTIRVVAE